jgi:T-complex protein 1 subunit beta
VTGGEITSTFDRPDLSTLGECSLIDEIMVGEDKLIRFSGCKSGQACSIILRGASSHLLDEAERSLHDALCVLTETVKETRVLCGGGCLEMLMATSIDQQVRIS